MEAFEATMKSSTPSPKIALPGPVDIDPKTGRQREKRMGRFEPSERLEWIRERAELMRQAGAEQFEAQTGGGAL
jgi:hypothetical protein